jgi:hypothetical protein
MEAIHSRLKELGVCRVSGCDAVVERMMHDVRADMRARDASGFLDISSIREAPLFFLYIPVFMHASQLIPIPDCYFITQRVLGLLEVCAHWYV